MRRSKSVTMAYKPMKDEMCGAGGEARDFELDELFHAYREACPDPEPSVNFMPAVWSKIEARQSSTTLFSRMARTLVGAALAATVILGMLISTESQAGTTSFDGTYMEAITADHVSSLDAMNLERISEMEQQ